MLRNMAETTEPMGYLPLKSNLWPRLFKALQGEGEACLGRVDKILDINFPFLLTVNSCDKNLIEQVPVDDY